MDKYMLVTIHGASCQLPAYVIDYDKNYLR